MEWLIGLVIVAAGVGYGVYSKKLKVPAFLNSTPLGQAVQHLTLAQQVATTGTAQPAAMNLYGYLKVHGADGSPAMTQLVGAFQTAANSDPNSTTLTGHLPTTGLYDSQTSAALTIYSHDPIPPATPPAPSSPPPMAVIMNASIPGSAATSGFNLYTYLKAHGNDKSAALQQLCHQFQIDVNTDPKAPGPASATGLPKTIPNPLPETGIYDAATAQALTVFSNDAISP